ncbi:ketosteroid isomerase-related protein [soil metagenome]
MTARATIEAYYDAFNRGDGEAMLALLAEDVEHGVDQGETRRGRDAFRAFNAHMARCYRERLDDLVVVSGDGRRAAAEFTVHGEYRATGEGLPEARGQTYTHPAGSFFALEGERITRVTTYYNLRDWLRRVGG